MRSAFFKLAIILLFAAFSITNIRAQDTRKDTLLANFVNPPNGARPRVWWHWMNGNISLDGIEKDLKWMHRAGIGGFHNFDAAWSTPQIVKQRLVFMTPEWMDAVRLTARLADSLKLEMAIAGSPGWSQSGGPWVKPENAMKKLVWRDTLVRGGKNFKGIIRTPPSSTGDFQDLGAADTHRPRLYRDISVIAYRLPDTEVQLTKLKPQITSSGGSFILSQLTDGHIAVSGNVRADSSKKQVWIQYVFNTPQIFSAITIADNLRDPSVNSDDIGNGNRSLQVSDDGINFKIVCFIPLSRTAQQTVSFKPVKARYFRIVYPNRLQPVAIAEFVLHSTSRVNRFEEKAGFATGIHFYETQTTSVDNAVAPGDIIDLSAKMDSNGTLNWKIPAGNWCITRFGYSLIGTTNHPASPEATGLEVDKMDADAVKLYFETYLDMYEKATGGLIGKKGGLQYLLNDSWEAGFANWTPKMPAEFLKRRGYDMRPWMPVLIGRIVKSAGESERFLWDFRKTLGELVVNHHYDQLTDILKRRGMLRYSESHELGRALIVDGMDVKRSAAIPMSAMWTPSSWSGPSEIYMPDMLESASVAHVYGQNIVAAESMTAFGNAWSWSPEKLKPTADLEMAGGLNRFVIHTSAHQPVDDKIPGLGLGPFGIWFNRHETWAEQARSWTDYLSRSSYMLQQGHFVADVAYYYGEDNNITSLFRHKLPDMPDGYKYDFINSDALLNQLNVKDHKLVTPAGMQYKLLVLDSNSRYMTLSVLKKIKNLVNAGANIGGCKPLSSPSLSDDQEEFNRIVKELWTENKRSAFDSTGRVLIGQRIADMLNELKITPDFKYASSDSDAKVLYVHRTLPDMDVYWINNRSDKAKNINADFRVTGKTVEIWHPESGRRELSSYRFNEGITNVPLHLQANDAVFVVFRGNASITSKTIPVPLITELATIKSPWHISFQKDRGAPQNFDMDSLKSWTETGIDGIKYFSGTAVYTNHIQATAKWFKKGSKIQMDLGEVKDVAEVFVNGKFAGTVWNKPLLFDLTGLVKKGSNDIQIKVTNLWVNRLIGDEQPGTIKKFTYTTERFYDANSPLLKSGLLGPVKVLSTQ